ncbi:cobalamin biosynthesis protein [Alkalimarinus sediminis]|uniref:Cobalamin biosynthesis protein n=1 Tax=Alkalimarinus sediminis TaxID=1632866 RepID=A0A9E8KQN6_9ALTE|nr:cobalamin biosynthesis protein [Alkalimarinus sediminis]UZW74992.1 cobalamin biosynthesis protein [Alkalimarinus sediminis]
MSKSNNSTIISLTDNGQQLASRLIKLGVATRHKHKPKPFAEQVQSLFSSGERLILICATGIAIRTLAPVLADKYTDPAVLVLDEHGRFVIPLLSGHEGGANEWAREVASVIEAQLVITSAQTYLKPTYIAGMGCERHCPKRVLRQLLEETLHQSNLTVNDLSGIASIDVKHDEVGLIELATELKLPFHTYSANILRTVEDQLTQKSEIVFKEVGCYGVAEAAALVDADNMARDNAIKPELLIPKHKNRQATCAVARIYQS